MSGIFDKLRRNALWPVLSLFPKDGRKAVCESFAGRGYSDSPKAIADELTARGWKVYWLINDPSQAKTLPSGIEPLIIGSSRAIYHMCTAGVWIDNCRKWGHIYKRPGQKYIQTWHGFPLKRIEGDAAGALDQDYIKAAKRDSQLCDLFISNSAYLTEIYRRAFWYDGPVLECGFPRNDMLFGPPDKAAKKVRAELSLQDHVRLALYAPTFRRELGLEVYDLDYKALTAALSRRFQGEWLIIAKLHPNVAARSHELNLDRRYVIDASGYPDIADLYMASSALITDYSSVMFDYMNTGKPCFLYVNDLDAYTADRNFYFDLDLLPFLRAQNNAGLCQNIESFDEAAQQERTARFCQRFGIKEDGSAAKKIADWIEQKT